VDGPEVVVEEIEVAAGDLERGRTVAKDALEAEDVPGGRVTARRREVRRTATTATAVPTKVDCS
jgi:hypothetical protein